MNQTYEHPIDFTSAAEATLAERKAFIAQVYSYVGLAGLSCAAGSYFVAREIIPAPQLGSWIIYLLILFGGFFLVRMVGSIPGIGVAALVGFTFVIGWLYSPLFLHFLAVKPQAFIMAGGTTALVFGSLTGYALLTKKDFSFLGGFLWVATAIVFAVVLFSFIFGSSIFVGSSVWSFAMVGLFSLWLLYDTSNVIHHFSTDQAVQAAIEIFWDVFVIFLHLLSLFGGRD